MSSSNPNYDDLVTRTLRLGLAQINPVVGDLWGNARLIVDWIGRARDLGADIVMFPELAITGYPPEELLLNINGSPYHEGKRVPREEMIAGRAADYGCFIAWVNTVGGQDELVFDGNSAVFSPTGKVLARAPSFSEDLLVYDVNLGSVP